jgi:hypothetical protein
MLQLVLIYEDIEKHEDSPLPIHDGCRDWLLCSWFCLSVHNTKHQELGPSTVLCRSQYQNWRRRLSFSGCSPCTGWTWKLLLMHYTPNCMLLQPLHSAHYVYCSENVLVEWMHLFHQTVTYHCKHIPVVLPQIWILILVSPQCSCNIYITKAFHEMCITLLLLLLLLLLLFLVGWDWVHLVLRPLLAYCTSPRW